jgi:hypothetical protein
MFITITHQSTWSTMIVTSTADELAISFSLFPSFQTRVYHYHSTYPSNSMHNIYTNMHSTLVDPFMRQICRRRHMSSSHCHLYPIWFPLLYNHPPRTLFSLYLLCLHRISSVCIKLYGSLLFPFSSISSFWYHSGLFYLFHTSFFPLVSHLSSQFILPPSARLKIISLTSSASRVFPCTLFHTPMTLLNITLFRLYFLFHSVVSLLFLYITLRLCVRILLFKQILILCSISTYR